MRVALHTRLREGSVQAYEAAHRDVPPALADAIRAAGARRWTIWRSGLDLFDGRYRMQVLRGTFERYEDEVNDQWTTTGSARRPEPPQSPGVRPLRQRP
jgi:L-rhamnose mutarotase